jgi:hypothetical protein
MSSKEPCAGKTIKGESCKKSGLEKYNGYCETHRKHFGGAAPPSSTATTSGSAVTDAKPAPLSPASSATPAQPDFPATSSRKPASPQPQPSSEPRISPPKVAHPVLTIQAKAAVPMDRTDAMPAKLSTSSTWTSLRKVDAGSTGSTSSLDMTATLPSRHHPEDAPALHKQVKTIAPHTTAATATAEPESMQGGYS